MLAHRFKNFLGNLNFPGHGIGVGQYGAGFVIKQITAFPIIQGIQLGLGDAFLQGNGGVLVGLIRGTIQYRHPHNN